MSEKDGGSAFPRLERLVDHSGSRTTMLTAESSNGLSLRDYFAGQALAGVLAAYSGEGVRLPDPDRAADFAYEYADAMLAERGKS